MTWSLSSSIPARTTTPVMATHQCSVGGGVVPRPEAGGGRVRAGLDTLACPEGPRMRFWHCLALATPGGIVEARDNAGDIAMAPGLLGHQAMDKAPAWLLYVAQTSFARRRVRSCPRGQSKRNEVG